MSTHYCHTWIQHFHANRHHRPEPHWAAPMQLPEEHRLALAATIAQYQLGDGGGPCCLIARDAQQTCSREPLFQQVVELWFTEEAEHSRLLGDALRRLRGQFVTDSLPFQLFKFTRRLINAQFEMLILLIVEIVSTGYYRLIRRHCKDQPIADMCALILRDEAGHIHFHRARLAAAHPHGISGLWALWFYTLGYACTAFLWLSHGPWLRRIGGSSTELFQHVHHGLRRFLRQLHAHTPQPSHQPTHTLRDWLESL